MLLDEKATFIKAKRHNCPNIVRFCNDLSVYERFFSVIECRRVGQFRRLANDKFFGIALRGFGEIRHVRNRNDDVLVKFTAQTFRHDFQMQHAEEAATEAKTQGSGRFRFKNERRIVELQLFKAVAEVFKIVVVNRINARKNHRFDFLKTMNGVEARARNVRQSIANFNVFG